MRFKMGSTNKAFGMIGVLVALMLLSQAVSVIPAGMTGVIFSLNGGVQKKPLKEGFHLVMPFIQELIIYDTRITTYSFTRAESSQRISGPVSAKTRDGQTVDLEFSIITQMLQDRTPEVYQVLRTDYLPVIRAKAGKVMQEVAARHVADALYTEETRQAVASEVYENLAESLELSGFKLYDVLLRRIGFSEEYIGAIENKQIALQKAQLAQIRKQIALKEKTIEIIKGDAKARVVEIKGRAIATNPQVAELEYLEAVEKNPKNIPVIMGLKGNNFVNIDKIMGTGN